MAGIEQAIIDVLTIWGEKLVNDSRIIIDQAIKADGGGQSSKLSGSAEYKVLNQGGTITFQFLFDKSAYWKFVDKGVDGTKNNWGSPYAFKKKNLNQKAMLNFIEKRHFKIDISDTKKKEIKSLTKKLKSKRIKKAVKQIPYDKKKKQLAFVLGRSIAEKGIKPTHFMDKIITQARIDDLKKMLVPVIKKEFVLELK